MKRLNLPWIVLITILAALIRGYLLIHSVDEPGDGPTRAIMAHQWAAAPKWVTSGVWLPGFLYLPGLFSWIVPDPRFSVRILNLLLGVASVPLLNRIGQRLYGPAVGLISAIGLTFLQLHIGLSVSSLTEVALLTFTLAALLSLITAVQHPKWEWLGLVAFLGFQEMAEMIRYEAWIFGPCFLAYYGLARGVTRKTWPQLLVMTIGTLALPVLWLVGNHVAFGNAWVGFTEANRGLEDGAVGVNAGQAIVILGQKLLHQVNLLVLIAIGWGIALRTKQCFEGLRFTGLRVAHLQAKPASHPPPSLEEALYVSIAAIYWLAMCRFTIVRGESLWERYLLFGVALLLPYAAWPLAAWLPNRQWRVGIVGGLMAIGLTLPLASFVPRYMTPQLPTAVINLCTWFNQSPYQNSAVLLTPMRWDASYFPLYCPSSLSRHLIASAWVSDTDIQRFVSAQRPKLLITREQDDRPFRVHLNQLVSETLAHSQLIHTEGTIQVYLLK
jgi:4-amino-4-deoxy-L-arabinose transferase-like glycosyltransferase